MIKKEKKQKKRKSKGYRKDLKVTAPTLPKAATNKCHDNPKERHGSF